MNKSTQLTDGIVVLRPLDLGDVAEHLAGEDEELVRWLNGGPGTRETVEAHVRACMAAWQTGGPTITFGIRAGEPERLVGTVDAHLELAGLEAGQANIAYGLYPQARGRGLGVEAVGDVRLAGLQPGEFKVGVHCSDQPLGFSRADSEGDGRPARLPRGHASPHMCFHSLACARSAVEPANELLVLTGEVLGDVPEVQRAEHDDAVGELGRLVHGSIVPPDAVAASDRGPMPRPRQ